MSNAFAIAAVSAALREMLRAAVLAKDITDVFVTAKPTVTTLSPNWLLPDNKDPSLNIFLYEVSENSGWANDKLPGRNSAGGRVANTPLALDLTYLLTAAASRDFEAEVLLGCAIQTLHEKPGISRNFIRRLANDNSAGLGGIPKDSRIHLLSLAEQVEAIKIAPRFLKQDDMSKLWSSFQINYRTSMAYVVSVVLIEATKPVSSAPRVLRRGPQDDNGLAQASIIPPFPTLLKARKLGPGRVQTLRAVPASPPVQGFPGIPGVFDLLRLYGHHLTKAGRIRQVRFRHAKGGEDIVIKASGITEQAPDLTERELEEDETLRFVDTQLNVQLGEATSLWSAGVYTVQVELVLPKEEEAKKEKEPPASNGWPVAIAPEFFLTGKDAPKVAGPTPQIPTDSITLTSRQPVRRGQKASLILDSYALSGEPQFADKNATTTTRLVFAGPLDALRETKPRARLLIDGIESPIILDTAGQPLTFDESHRITIPE